MRSRCDLSVVATLINGEDDGPAKDGALGALWVAAEAFGNHSTGQAIPDLPDLPASGISLSAIFLRTGPLIVAGVTWR
jgi:hypothetical protein